MVMIRNRRTGETLNVEDKDLAKYRIAQPQVQEQAQPQQKESLLVSLLPLLGSLLGGTVGAVGGPAGIIAGSGIGSGIGETARQGISGQQLQLNKILGETGIGALGGGAGVLLGGLTKAGRLGQAVAGSADDVTRVAAGSADDVARLATGTKFAAKPYTSQAIKTLKGAKIAERAGQVGKTAAGLKGATAPRKLTSLGTELGGLTEQLRTITRTGALAKAPVVGTETLGKVVANAQKTAVDLTRGGGKSAISFWGPKITKATSVAKLSKLNQEMLTELSKVGMRSKQGRILQSIQKPVTDELGRLAGTGEIMGRMSALKAAEPIIQKQASKVSTGPFQIGETGIPQRLQEGIQSGIGSATNFATGPTGTQIGGQLGARALTGGGEENQEYIPEAVDMASMGYAPEQEKQGINITAEQVALARLLLPKAQADAIDAAYKVLEKKGTASASQEFLDKAEQTIDVARNIQGPLGYGPIKGLQYSLQMRPGGGAGVPTEVVQRYQAYEVLRLNILRAYQGARISDKDFDLAQRYIPSIADTAQTAKVKMDLLEELLTSAKTPEKQTEMTYQLD